MTRQIVVFVVLPKAPVAGAKAGWTRKQGDAHGLSIFFELSPKGRCQDSENRDRVAEKSDIEEKMMDMNEQGVAWYDLVGRHIVRFRAYPQQEEDAF